jgi:ketosteroid isomerase-like protein
MAGSRVWVTVVVVAGLIGAGSLLAPRVGATIALTAQDVSDITQLYSTSYQGADLRDADLWLSAYADDAVFNLPTGSQVVGRKALAEWRMKSFGGKTGDTKQRHWFGLIRVLPAPNGATAKAYFSVIDVGAKQPTIRSTGTVDDRFVKTAAGWKFKVHTVIFDVPND